MSWSRSFPRLARQPLLMGLAMAVASPAGAAEVEDEMFMPDLAPALGAVDCGFSGPASAPASPDFQVATQSSKASAILGGQPSALEAMRLAQESGASAFGVTPEALATGQAPAELALAPAVGGARPAMACTLGVAPPQPASADPENFLASKRLRIGRTSFDGAWQRVSDDRISSSRYRHLLGAASEDPMATLATVNRWVNQAVTYTEDRALFGRNDYWAGAKRTLALRRGDCEDIALTKMELLAAAGIRHEDMVLTIARDLARNADHAVLIVRLDGRYYMLDNATDQVLDASASHDYRPVLSFSDSQTWLHGY